MNDNVLPTSAQGTGRFWAGGAKTYAFWQEYDAFAKRLANVLDPGQLKLRDLKYRWQFERDFDLEVSEHVWRAILNDRAGFIGRVDDFIYIRGNRRKEAIAHTKAKRNV